MNEDEITLTAPTGDPVHLVVSIDVHGSGAQEARDRLEDAERLDELVEGIEELFERLSGFVTVTGSTLVLRVDPDVDE